MIPQFMTLILQIGYLMKCHHVVFARSGKIYHEHEDFASIMLGYKENKTAIISSNWITPKKCKKI